MGLWPRFLTIPREPDFVIGGADRPYLRRWWVIPRNRWFNVYLHHFLRSDDDRALHDHPWWNVSILLRGSYIEMLPGDRPVRRRPFRPVGRRATAAHRVMLDHGPRGLEPVWTLFITGPRIRDWGFWCGTRWVHWQDFTDSGTDGATVGKGCGE